MSSWPVRLSPAEVPIPARQTGMDVCQIPKRRRPSDWAGPPHEPWMASPIDASPRHGAEAGGEKVDELGMVLWVFQNAVPAFPISCVVDTRTGQTRTWGPHREGAR